MTDTTIRDLTPGAAIGDADLFVSRQGADTEDKSVTGLQIRGYTVNLLLNSQTGATYTVIASDRAKLVKFTGSANSTFDFTAAATLGNGWYCYIQNASDYEVTLDPSSTEQIDGLTNYVMYPGEVRLVQCTGTAFNTVVLNGFYYRTLVDDTFIMPPGYPKGIEVFGVGAGGGGGGGCRRPTSGIRTGGAGGGGGGSRTDIVTYNDYAAGSSISIVCGTGGAGGSGATSNANGANGSGGNNTTFGTYTFFGGAGGLGGSTSSTRSGGYGGTAISNATGTVNGISTVSPGQGGYGGAAVSTLNSDGGSFSYDAGGGGGPGGGFDAATNYRISGPGGGSAKFGGVATSFLNTGLSAQGGGGAGGAVDTNGTNGAGLLEAGGGGGGSSAANAGAGGAGGAGGGGGGGGAGNNDSALNGGDGGAGGNGFVMVYGII